MSKLSCIRLFLLFGILGLGLGDSIGQNRDTIYLNQAYEHVYKGDHQYYRVIDSIGRSKFLIRDYYYSGALKTEARSKTADAGAIKGTVRHYYESGPIQRVSKYKNHTSGAVTFYSETGEKISKVRFKDDEKVGAEVYYGKNGKKISEVKYIDGVPFEGMIPAFQRTVPDQYFNFVGYELAAIKYYYKYYSNGELAMKATLTGGDWAKVKADFFDEKGNSLGSCFYQNNVPSEGSCIEFYEEYMPGVNAARAKLKSKFFEGKLVERWSYDYNGFEIGYCTYKDGRPYNGTVLEGNTAVSYLNGGIEGKITEYNPAVSQIQHEYHLVKGTKHGATSYYCSETDSLYKGSYKQGLPENGFVLVEKELCYYTDGYRDGLCLQYNPQGALHIISHFKEGARNGIFEFRGHAGLGSIIGAYRSNRPFEGDFTDRRSTPTIKKYQAGQLKEEKLYNAGPLRMVEHRFYNDEGQVVKKIIYDDSEKSGYQLILENGTPKMRAIFQDAIFIEGCTEEPIRFDKNTEAILAKICVLEGGDCQISFQDDQNQIEVQIRVQEAIDLSWPLDLEPIYLDQVDREEKCYLTTTKEILFQYKQAGSSKNGNFVRPYHSKYKIKGDKQESALSLEEMKLNSQR